MVTSLIKRSQDAFRRISPEELSRETLLSETSTCGSGPIDPHFLKIEVETFYLICQSVTVVFEKPQRTFASLEGIWKGKVDFSLKEIEEAKITFS